MKNKRAEWDMFDFMNLIMMIAVIILFIVVVLVMIFQSQKANFCENSGGQYTASGNCLKGETLYSIENTNAFGFIPEYKLAKLGVSER